MKMDRKALKKAFGLRTYMMRVHEEKRELKKKRRNFFVFTTEDQASLNS